jgi:hypothetical protein
MAVLENIFYLCIVYIVFNFIWGILVQLPKMILTKMKSNKTVDHSIKAIRYLLLSTLTYSTCYSYAFENTLSNGVVILIYITGGIILSLYLAGKLNKKQSLFKLATNITTSLKFGKKNFSSIQLSYEKHIVGISIVIFGACVGIPAFGEIMAMNPVNIWFLNTIDGLYNAPLLKWLIGFCGIIFMFSMFQRAISTIQQLILKLKGEEQEEEKDNPLNKIMDEFQKMNTTNQSFNKDDKELDIDEDMYVDFEEMKEDQEKEKK